MTKKNDINKLITSRKLVINNKFLASISMMDTGVTPKTYCIVVLDLTGNNFKIKYFATEETATDFIQLLYNMKD